MSTKTPPQSIIDTIEIENIVTASDLGRQIDLSELSKDLDTSEFDEATFPGLIYKVDECDLTILLFRSGKLICTGAGSVTAVENGIKAIEDEFKSIGFPHEPINFDIQNVVGTAEIADKINLNAAAIGLGLETTEYEPEQFPGLIYRMNDIDIVSIIFASGKIVITSGETPDEIKTSVERVYNDIDELGLL